MKFFKPTMRPVLVILFMFAILNMNTAAYAAQSAVNSSNYWERMPARFGYGLVNTVFGWSALIKAPVEAHQAGLPAGEAFSRAMVYPFSYTFFGIWDLLTFWVPGPGELGREMSVPKHIFMPTAEKASAPVPHAKEPA